MAWDTVYQDTLVTEHYAYFDTGAAAPPPKQVIDVVTNYLERTATLGTYLPSFRKEVYAEIENIRDKLAQFLGGHRDEIAFTKNGTDAICMAAQGIDWQAGDEIIVPDTEMQSNLSVWLLLEKQRGVKVVRAYANPEGLIDPDTIAKLITPKTRLLTFVVISNATGAVQPVKQLCDLAKQHHVLTLINASQSVGLLEMNVHELGCDMLAACGRKGLRAIEGSGFLYVRHPLITQMTPCIVGWWNSSFNATGELVFPENGKRFEPGCPNVPAVYSLGAALDYVQTLGMKSIEQRVRTLTGYAIKQLSTINNFECYGPSQVQNRLGLIPFNIKGVDPIELVTMLEQNGVIIEAGHFMASAIMKAYAIERMARLSLHYFNNEAQLDKTVQLIKDFCHSINKDT